MGEQDDDGDIDPGDLDDLGDLGDGDDDPDDDGDDGDGKPSKKALPIPDQAGWDKIQRKLARQEERISRLIAAKKTTPAKKTAAKKTAASDADAALLAALRGTRSRAAQADDDDDEDDGEGSQAQHWKTIAIQNAAASQIAAAGFSGTAKQAARLARLIDTSDIEPNKDGSFDLEDEIEELQEEYPQLFAQAVDGRGRRLPPVSRRQSREAPKVDPSRKTSNDIMRAAGYR